MIELLCIVGRFFDFVHMKQLALFDIDLYSQVSYSGSDFVRMEINSDQFQYIDQWPKNWRDSALLILGPRYSGKTHMAKIWQEKTRAVCISDAILIDDSELFSVIDRHDSFYLDIHSEYYNNPEIEKGVLHLLNLTREQKSWLLILARPEWINTVKLRDLSSRLRAMQTVFLRLGILEDHQASAILLKCMTDYQLSLPREHYKFLEAHMIKTIEAINRLCALIGEHAMQQPSKLTKNSLKRILQQLHAEYSNADNT